MKEAIFHPLHRLAWCLLLSAGAALAPGYERWNLVSEPVYSQEQDELAQVARIGAGRALTRLTGARHIPENLPEWRRPLQLVQEYGFVESPMAGLRPWFNSPVQEVRFLYSEEAIAAIGQRLEMTHMPGRRARVALWVAYTDDDSLPRLLTGAASDAPDMLYLLRGIAKDAWPLLHLPALEDTQWQGAADRLDWHLLADMGAQRGYDETWVVQLAPHGPGWRARWVQPAVSQVRYGERYGGSRRDALDGALQAMVQMAWEVYRYQPGPVQSYRVTLQGMRIDTRDDYQRLRDGLHGMSGVERVTPIALGAREMQFRVEARAPYERLLRDLDRNARNSEATIVRWGEP